MGKKKKGNGNQENPAQRYATASGRGWSMFAITVPLAMTLISISWAIASYFMVRERCRAQVALAQLKASGALRQMIER